MADTYYIKQDGDDALDGKSDANAWASLGKVLTAGLNPGDIVLLKRGHAWREILKMGDSGTLENKVKVGAYDSGAKPIINGADLIEGLVGGTEKLTNGAMEWAGSVLTGWTVTPYGSSTVTKNDTTQWQGDHATQIAISGTWVFESNDAKIQHAAAITDTGRNVKRRVVIRHKRTVGSGYLAVVIWRGIASGVGCEYLTQALEWDDVSNFYGIALESTDEWQEKVIEFDLGDNSHNWNDYFIQIRPTLVAALTPLNSNSTWHVDGLSWGEAGTSTPELMPDPEFQDYIGNQLNPDNWTSTTPGNSLAIPDNEHNPREKKTLRLQADENTNIPFIESKIIKMEANSSYKLTAGWWGRQNNPGQGALSSYTPYLQVLLKRLEATPEYYDGSTNTWGTSEAVMFEGHSPDVLLRMGEKFTTPSSGVQNYQVIIRPKAGTISHDQMINVAYCSLERDVANTVYHGYIEAPGYTLDETSQVYMTGILDRVSVDHERVRVVPSEADQFRRTCSYNTSDQMLTMNIGMDPGALTVEMAKREFCLDTNEQSHFEFEDIQLTGSREAGAYIQPEATGATRVDGFTFNRCTIDWHGRQAIRVGFMPADPPDANSPAGTDTTTLTPANLTVEDCSLEYWGRSEVVKLPYNPGSGSKPWWQGYQPQNKAIAQFMGADVVGGLTDAESNAAGAYHIQRNSFYMDDHPHNLSAARGAGWVHLSNDAQINENFYWGVMHGSGIIGSRGTIDGLVIGTWSIMRNYYKYMADSAIWVNGASTVGHVAYNTIFHSADNGIDWENAYGYVYNNLISYTHNEGLVLWGNNLTAGYFFNNIFYNWNQKFMNFGYSVALGSAIGVGVGDPQNPNEVVPAYSAIDYNWYYADPERANTDNPFHYDRVQENFAAWQARGVDKHSVIGIDPGFVDPANGDFRLKPTSPLIDGGFPLEKMKAHAYFGYADSTDPADFFDPSLISNRALNPESSWPQGVHTIPMSALGDQGTWEAGPYAYVSQSFEFSITNDGDPVSGLTPIVDMYRGGTGQDKTPVPEVVEIGNGAYAIYVRETQKIVGRVDSGDVSHHPADRYTFFKTTPFESHITRIRHRLPVTGLIAGSKEIDALNDFDPATQEVTTDSASREASKADVSGLALQATLTALQSAVAALKNFDPVTQSVIIGAVGGNAVTSPDDFKATKASLGLPLGIKKNTPLSNFPFIMTDANGNPLPSLTVTAKRVLDGGAEAAMASTPAYVAGSEGLYRINIAAADNNCVAGTWIFSAEGAKTKIIHFITQE